MEKIPVLDFGGQYNQLTARRVRALHVFAGVQYRPGFKSRPNKAHPLFPGFVKAA